MKENEEEEVEWDILNRPMFGPMMQKEHGVKIKPGDICIKGDINDNKNKRRRRWKI